ncbi:plasmid pRiA4b ORF-3 family protein [Solitalea sp. MAHUQ-68]|uniref:Plasmid pRiA4b ORF-3 family protein n=1 Tax=Solitalea agri TaxID=2953739 RepID=A0A9X2JF78_9SPHI|nr:plasmid pRiA4b ORF-3 family protein [Solitalea agri]MCO4294700.1 plasmid pRiA4b ORF-3 family protein [Solitalea agri]
MAIYRFRVAFEDYDAVREIDIKSNQTFEDFHYAIHKSINFDAGHPSSFYVSNDQWVKGEELAFMPAERKVSQGIKLMKDFKLSKFIDDPHQKFYYISNFDRPFDFHVELSKIFLEPEAGVEYPVCVKSTGDVPKQFRVSAVAAAANKDPLEVLEDEFDIEEPEELDEFGIDVEDFSSTTSSKSDDEDSQEESEAGEDDDEFGELGFGSGSDDEYGERDDY